MKISGTAVLNAPVDQVWAAFNDPAVLARTIPGCQELREVGPDVYKMTVTAGVASIKGTYEGNVALTEQNPPSFLVLRAAGATAVGRPPFQGRDFLYGALAGAAIALAGVAVGIAAGGR